MDLLFYDSRPIDSYEITDDGFMIVDGILSRTGIQDYTADQIFDAKYLKDNAISPKKIIKLYRSPEEVFNDESIKSLDNKPITLGHPKGNVVNSSNSQRLSKGVVNNVRKNNDVSTAGKLTIFSKDAVDSIIESEKKGRKKELSVGYSSRVEMIPGTTPEGEKYDGIQTRIRGNHHAIVDAGRCGTMCRIGDEEDSDNNPGEKVMATKVVMVDSAAVETDLVAAAQIERLIGERNAAKMLVDTASVQSGELKIKLDAANEKLTLADAKVAESAAKITTLEAELKAKPSTVKIGDKELSLEDAAKQLKDMEDEVASMKKKTDPEAVDELVKKRMKTLESGKKVAPKVVADGLTDEAYRKEVVKAASASTPNLKVIADAVLGDAGFDKASEDSILAAFNAITAAQVATSNQRGQSVLGDRILDSTTQQTGVVSMRQKATDTITNAWQKKATA